MRFLFGLNTIAPEPGDWTVLSYNPVLRLTNNRHIYVGYDEMRNWLKSRGLPFAIDGVIAEPSTFPVDLQKQSIPLTESRASATINSTTLVLVEVADEIAMHFKLRWC